MAVFDVTYLSSKKDLLNEATSDKDLEEKTNKIMDEFMKSIKEVLDKNKKIKSTTIDHYQWRLDIVFSKPYPDEDEWAKFVKDNIISVINSKRAIFEKKYKTKFYWNDKVSNNDGILIQLDTDYHYDNK